MKRFYIFLLFCVSIATQVNAQLNWVTQNSGTTEDLLDIEMYDTQTIRAVGTHSAYLNTVTGGFIWIVGSTSSGNSMDWNAVSFIGPLHGWLAGQNNTSFTGQIWKTIDGGTFVPQLLYKFGTYDVKSTSTSTAYAACDSATILHTTNGGFNWSPITGTPSTDSKFLGIAMYSGSSGFAVGEDGLVGKISGATFSVQTSPVNEDLNAVFSVNADTAFACGDNGTLIYTFDNGTTWMDGSPGIQWTMTDFHDLYMVSSKTGTIVGEDGTILQLGNGSGWHQVSSGTQKDLNAIDISGITGFIAGDDGVILKNLWVFIDVEEHFTDDLSVYPNPAQNELHFENLGNESAQVDVINSIGQTVATFEVNRESPQVDISNISNGTYLLNLRMKNRTIRQTLVIAK